MCQSKEDEKSKKRPCANPCARCKKKQQRKDKNVKGEKGEKIQIANI